MKKVYIQIFVSTPNEKEANKIAYMLVKRKLAGCVQILGPIKSTFRWKEKIEKAKEWLCFIKTTEENYKRIEDAIKKVHPYSIPEIIAMPLVAGNKDYFSWLSEETK